MNQWPPVILPALNNVHFVTAFRPIKPAWSMFGLKHHITARLPIHSLRVAMTIRPDLRSRVSLTGERIVLRHTAVVVETQRLSTQRIEFLCDLATRGVTGREVELAIRSKANTTAGVKLRGGNVLDNHRAIDQAVGRFAITRNAHLVFCVGVREIDEVITAELRMQ